MFQNILCSVDKTIVFQNRSFLSSFMRSFFISQNDPSRWYIVHFSLINIIVDKNDAPSMIYEQEPVKKRIVMVLGRQHPGESPSSFIVQGKVKTTCNNPSGRHFKVKQAAISKILFCLFCSISTLHMPHL